MRRIFFLKRSLFKYIFHYTTVCCVWCTHKQQQTGVRQTIKVRSESNVKKRRTRYILLVNPLLSEPIRKIIDHSYSLYWNLVGKKNINIPSRIDCDKIRSPVLIFAQTWRAISHQLSPILVKVVGELSLLRRQLFAFRSTSSYHIK